MQQNVINNCSRMLNFLLMVKNILLMLFGSYLIGKYDRKQIIIIVMCMFVN